MKTGKGRKMPANRKRATTLEALESKIEKAKQEYVKAERIAKEKGKKLDELMEKKNAILREKLVEAILKSDRSYDEVMAFLKKNGQKDGENE